MIYDLLTTLLELGDATSQNLSFAYQDDVYISYGEETITETNLLELRRRHPSLIVLKTFTRPKEAKNGADWEWHIIGKKWTFGMRVQAKRVQKDGKLKINHTIKSTGKKQIDILLDSAKKGGIGNRALRPVYCFYCADEDLTKWSAEKSKPTTLSYRRSEYGCLIADATKIKAISNIKKLADVECISVPWHFLFQNKHHRMLIYESKFLSLDTIKFHYYNLGKALYLSLPDEIKDCSDKSEFPTADQLNGIDDTLSDNDIGVWKTEEMIQKKDSEVSLEATTNISRFISIDVSKFRDLDD